MASIPHPFQVEDNTDEDFFDKLVNDDEDVDFKVTAGAPLRSLPSDGNESDEIKGFEDLKIGELDHSHDNAGGSTDFHLDNLDTSKTVEQINEPGVEEKNGYPLASVNSLEFNGLEKEGGVPNVLSNVTSFSAGNNEGLSGTSALSKSGDDPSLVTVATGSSGEGFSENNVMTKSSGDSESTGAKEVGWGMFNAESDGNDRTGFGSYSNFFSELGESDADKVQNVVGNNVNDEQHVSTWTDAHGSASVANSNTIEQSAGGQDFNSIEYWENQYPGWKYDPSSGQWYESSRSVQADNDDKANLSYMQQGFQSVAVAETESGTTGSVTNWNQASQGSDAVEAKTNLNQIPQGSSSTATVQSDWSQVAQGYTGYPPHMVFDPQYPGWYYDTIAQEWCSLESYTESIQPAAQVQDQIFDNQNTYDTHNQGNVYHTENFGNLVQDQRWIQPVSNYNQMNSSMWQPNTVTSFETSSWNGGNQLVEGHSVQNPQHYNDYRTKNSNMHATSDYFVSQNSSDFSKKHIESAQISYVPAAERLSAGRPAHALVAFGFGGKLLVLKDNSSPANSYFANQNIGNSISVLNLAEVVSHNADVSDHGLGVCSYFKAVLQHCVPGPLSGGNAGRELSKWIDERIEDSNSADVDYRRSEVLKLLLKLLKIACQYYGKLRSPYGTDVALKESDAPESAVAKLFASAGRNGSQFHQYDMVAQCLRQIPSEGQIQITAAEVQRLLVSGRKKEALQCAQEGQLWGPAIVLAAQLGDQFYAETVKQMALYQFVAGSPLRTLCLLISGQPADVFAVDNTAISSMAGSVNMSQSAQFAANGMLDDWAENLAVITANRTKDDELVLMHLGDCLWRERSDIIAAHICYLVAEANFEPYSDTARMCLIGADHWKFPRTYASPEAIQRTEIYEYSKTLGNSQFVLLPFQPYKYIYAHMLAEVGRLSDALKYCQAILKSLKTGRTPEEETLRHLVSSFEERIKSHQQGGFSANLAPKKIVGALLNLLDSTAHRVVGGAPPIPAEGVNARINDNTQSLGPRVSTSQSTLAMSSLVPSQSFEPISDWGADSNKMAMYSRSVSEPDFGRSPVQGHHVNSLKEPSSAGVPDKASTTAGTSRFGRFRFGSQLLQKTVGLVLKPRQGHQAKLGETNKFYYDEKLKRWVEEGAETPAEEAALPPPPTTSVLQNGPSSYNLKNALENEPSYSSRIPEPISSTTLDSSSGMPPLPPTSNQYSARGRMSVRSRYVDTFNKGGGQAANLFQPPSAPVKPAASGSNPTFFVPAPVSGVEQQVDAAANGVQDSRENPPSSSLTDSFTMQRFASMDNIIHGASNNGSFSVQSRRTASWSGSLNDPSVTPHSVEAKRVFGTPPSRFMPRQPVSANSSIEGGNSGDELQEVEL